MQTASADALHPDQGGDFHHQTEALSESRRRTKSAGRRPPRNNAGADDPDPGGQAANPVSVYNVFDLD
jgi:hypothetical protein